MKEFGNPDESPRCLGAAIHTALHLIKELGLTTDGSPDAYPERQGMSRNGLASGSGRVLVVTTGATSRVSCTLLR